MTDLQRWTGGQAEPPEPDRTAERYMINQVIADHALKALELIGDLPQAGMHIFGQESYAHSVYHAHRANALRTLADADHGRAVAYVREHALEAFRAAAPPGGAA